MPPLSLSLARALDEGGRWTRELSHDREITSLVTHTHTATHTKKHSGRTAITLRVNLFIEQRLEWAPVLLNYALIIIFHEGD